MLVTTVVEIVLLVWAYRGLMALPWIRDLNLEGPRRIVSMYAVSYALKWVIAVTVLRVAPSLPVADLYGFGYLLTSLVALKCYQKGHTVRVLGTLLATVAQGVVLGLGISVALAWVVPPAGPPATASGCRVRRARRRCMASTTTSAATAPTPGWRCTRWRRWAPPWRWAPPPR